MSARKVHLLSAFIFLSLLLVILCGNWTAARKLCFWRPLNTNKASRHYWLHCAVQWWRRGRDSTPPATPTRTATGTRWGYTVPTVPHCIPCSAGLYELALRPRGGVCKAGSRFRIMIQVGLNSNTTIDRRYQDTKFWVFGKTSVDFQYVWT